jgi:PAS domain S-box-containing protein
MPTDRPVSNDEPSAWPGTSEQNHASFGAMPDLLALRAAFLNNGHFPEGVRPIVFESWQRSRGYGVDPEHLRQQTPDCKRLAAARAENELLLGSAAPLLALLHEKLANSPHVVALSDGQGYILRLLADAATANNSATQSANIFEGASWNEKDIGCNGIGTCLAAGKPVVLIGPEHFQNAYLNWTCIGVPLKSPQGGIIGALDLSVPNLEVQAATWGWVLSLAREIESNLARGSGEPLPPPPSEWDKTLGSLTGIFELLVTQLNLPPTHARFVDEASRAVMAAITDRQKAEEELRKANQKLHTTLDSISDGLLVVDRNGHSAYCSETGARMIGMRREELIGRCIWDLFPEARSGKFYQECQRALESGQPVRFEEFYPEPVNKWLECHCYPSPEGLSIYFNDITRRKQAEFQLRRNHDTFYHLIQNNPFGVYVVDADFRLRQVSLGSQKVFSHVRPLLGRDFAEVLRAIWTEPFASQAIARFRHTLETGEPYAAPSTVERRQDIAEIEAYDWRIERVILPDGRFGVVCYFYDLSERQRWEAALQESETRFRQLAESMPQLVWTARADGQMDYLNHRISEYRGARQNPENHWEWQAMLHPDDLAPTMDAWRRAVQQGANYQIEHRLQMADGSYRWHLDRAYPSRDAGGQIVKWFGTSTDIDHQKRAQEILEQTVQERTARLRDTIAELEHFSYTITHDMRAPLRAMQAFGQILREEYDSRFDQMGRDYLRRITEAAGRMDNLILDALDYSKAVRTELTLEPIDPGPLLQGIVESYPHFQPPRAEIELTENFPLVLANEAGLIQCFSNLLGNAVKFVEPGKVPRVRVWAEQREKVVRLWIEDNGIGISPGQQERVFVMFQRLSKRHEGTGIGLTLVRKVVERMQGKVGFESEPGNGSRFWIELAAIEPMRQ